MAERTTTVLLRTSLDFDLVSTYQVEATIMQTKCITSFLSRLSGVDYNLHQHIVRRSNQS